MLLLLPTRKTWSVRLLTFTSLQVSVSGQALVFVVRCTGLSWRSRAGSLTYAAFFMAQVRASHQSLLSRGQSWCLSTSWAQLAWHNFTALVSALHG